MVMEEERLWCFAQETGWEIVSLGLPFQLDSKMPPVGEAKES